MLKHNITDIFDLQAKRLLIKDSCIHLDGANLTMSDTAGESEGEVVVEDGHHSRLTIGDAAELQSPKYS